MKDKRKIIAFIIVILLIFNALPVQNIESHAELSTIYERGEYPRSETEFYEMLDMLKLKTINKKKKSVNWNTFKDKELIVYGNPNGDIKNGEYRYLGYNIDNQPFTNSDFPPDAGAQGDNPKTWNFLPKENNEISWSTVRDNFELMNWITSQVLQGNHAEDYGFKLDLVGDEEYIKKHFLLLTPPSVDAHGSVFTRFTRSTGGERYATFYIPKLPGTVNVNTTVTTPQDTYIIPSGTELIYIPVTVTTNVEVGGNVTPSYITRTGSYFSFIDANEQLMTSGEAIDKSMTSTHTIQVPIYRKDYSLGEHEITFNGMGASLAVFGLAGTDMAEKTVTLKVSNNQAYLSLKGVANPNPVELVDGKGNTELTLTAEVFDLEDDTPKTWTIQYQNSDGAWVTHTQDYYGYSLSHKFPPEELIKDHTFKIKASLQTEKGNVLHAEGEVFVYTTNPAPTEINPDLWADATPGTLEIPLADYLNNRDQTITLELDASDSTAETGIKEYMFYFEVGDTDIWHYSPWTSNPVYTVEDVKILPSYFDEDTKELILDCRVAVRDNMGNVKYASEDEDLKMVIVTRPPETQLEVPPIGYPLEVTKNTSLKNIVTWNYLSPDMAEYKESMVSLDKWNSDSWTNVINEKVQTDKFLEITGNAEEEYRVRVKVVDEYGTPSEEVSETIFIETAKPDIEVTVDATRAENGYLDLSVENLTHPEVEALYPTEYTNWKVANAEGMILESGTGKLPTEVEMDENYRGTVVTAIQYAENILGNTAMDKDFYSDNAILEFDIVPNRLFETELTTIVDYSKGLKNRMWSIKKDTDQGYKPFAYPPLGKFTKEAGMYSLRSDAEGKYIYPTTIDIYSNNRLNLYKEPKEPTEDKIKSMFGEDITFAKYTAFWDLDTEIIEGEFNDDGVNYNFKRTARILLMRGGSYARAKNVEFIDATPNAIFDVSGSLKMYKKVSVDGSKSVDITDAELQAKYPIQFDHENTMFIVEPMTALFDGEADYSRNEFIKGEGREIVDGKVVFKGKKIQDLRFDKDGVYRITYITYNGIKSSKPFIKEIVIEAEQLPSVDINVAESVVYRNPDNDLKAILNVVVDYFSPDDEIDLDKSELRISYDANNNGNFKDDGLHSTQRITRNTNELQEYLMPIGKTIAPTQASYSIVVDNPDKNMLGKYRFEFTAVEKPKIPNFNIGGDIPVIKVDTALLSDDKKTILVDNLKPIIDLKAYKGNSVELNIIETSVYNKVTINDINTILNQFTAQEIKATIHYMDINGNVTIHKN